MGGSASAARWRSRRSATAPRDRSHVRATTRCRPGPRPTRPCCAAATRATPRRRSPPTRPRAPWARAGSSARPVASWPRPRAPTASPVVPLPGRLSAARDGRLHARGGARGRRAVGVGEQLHTEIDVAAAHAEQLVAEWGPDAPEDSLAKRLARALQGTIPQIVGAGLTTPIAYRWKTQINENAKVPCFASELPELDHNEIVGWEGAPELGRFSAVLLDDSDLHPRVRARIELTRELIASQAAVAERVETVGRDADRAARLAGAARRSGVALPGGPARRRSRLDRIAGAPQERARRDLSACRPRPRTPASPQTLTRSW